MSEDADNPLELATREQGRARIVRVLGSVSLDEADRFRHALEELAAAAVLLVLDLSEMDFICSTGLGAIIAMHQKLRGVSGDVKLVNPQPAIRQMLEATRLTKLFGIYASVEDAVS